MKKSDDYSDMYCQSLQSWKHIWGDETDELGYLPKFFESSSLRHFFGQQKDTLVHYTSAEGLLGILKSNKLRFTEASCLNDELEGNIIFDILKELLPQYETEFKDKVNQKIEHPSFKDSFKCFIFSLSTETDSLSLWNYYVKNPSMMGYNLQFNNKILSKGVKDYCSNNLDNINSICYPVIYDKRAQKLFLELIVQNCYNQWKKEKSDAVIKVLLGYIYALRFLFKHKAFFQEQEIRFVIYMSNEFFINELKAKDNDSEVIKIQARHDLIVPFIEVPFDKIALEAIGVSPLIKNKAAVESINLLLGKYGYENVKLLHSTIPLKY